MHFERNKQNSNFDINTNSMATIIAFSTTVEKIINEVEKFDEIEQESILASLRARYILKHPGKNIASISKPLSMAAIDSIKHKSRQNAGK
jgi:hypothetical protein